MDTGETSENRDHTLLDCSSLGNFVPLPSDEVLGLSSTFSGSWTPLDAVEHSMEFVASSISSHGLIDNSYVDTRQIRADIEPNIPCFGSGNFSEMDSFFVLHKYRSVANSGCSADCPLEEVGIKDEKALRPQSSVHNYVISQEEGSILHEGTMKPSPDGKKRRSARDDQSQFKQLKNMKTEKDQCIAEQTEKKLKTEQKPVGKTGCQSVHKEVKDSSTSGDAPKGDYVHVRAKRGQATNSHSLAERVRREKIRERMKFLQDIIPGCNKITGKAVMLDEIINYVLSLQRQVEFLSMKLATVYPETNDEPGEQTLSRDIHHSQGGSTAILGDARMCSYPKGILPEAFLSTQISDIELTPMQNVASIWKNGLQNTSNVSDMDPDKPKIKWFH